jgi:CRISPR-associated protein Cas5h
MLNSVVVSFRVSGEFAAFRDPSVTSNQTVYYIPSKSAVIGLLGAILGVERDHSLAEIYSRDYVELFKKTEIGMELESDPRKISFFTNHRSLKEPKTKPFKTEVLVSPSYRIYVKTDDSISNTLRKVLKENDFKYPPYLGHAYCPARISEMQLQEMTAFTGCKFETSSVILDESETYNTRFSVTAEPLNDNSRIIIERHLHHFFENGQLERRVLRHWIPARGSVYEVDITEKPKLSSYYSLQDGGKVVCFY